MQKSIWNVWNIFSELRLMLYFKWLFIDFRSVCVIFAIFINATLQQVKNECSFCKKLINSKFLLVFKMMTKEKTIRIEMCIVEMHAYLQNTKEHITHDKHTNIQNYIYFSKKKPRKTKTANTEYGEIEKFQCQVCSLNWITYHISRATKVNEAPLYISPYNHLYESICNRNAIKKRVHQVKIKQIDFADKLR